MLRRVVEILIHNLGIKLLALLFAIAMWMAVVNLDDPTISKTFTIAITVENESAITNMDKYYEIDNDSLNATFNVVGTRSIIDQLGNSDFKATADLAQLVQGDDENLVPVEITALTHASKLRISNRTRQIRVVLEDLRRETFGIQAGTMGIPADGYALGDLTVTPNRLRVSGPKEAVSRIDSVKAVIDVSGASTEVTDNVVLSLLDKDGEVIDTTKLTLSINTVTVKAGILAEKAVPIRVNYSGTPVEGHEVISVKAKPNKVKIKGRPDILNAISAITIPDNVVNVDGADEEFEQRVDINQYLPDRVWLSDSTQASIAVVVDVEQLDRRVYTVPVSNIGIDNMPEGYRIAFLERTVEVPVYALTGDLNNLTVNAIRPVLSVGGLMAGRHVGTLTFKLDRKYTVGDVVVSFTIYTEETGGNGGQADDQPPQEGNTAADDGSGT